MPLPQMPAWEPCLGGLEALADPRWELLADLGEVECKCKFPADQVGPVEALLGLPETNGDLLPVGQLREQLKEEQLRDPMELPREQLPGDFLDISNNFMGGLPTQQNSTGAAQQAPANQSPASLEVAQALQNQQNAQQANANPVSFSATTPWSIPKPPSNPSSGMPGMPGGMGGMGGMGGGSGGSGGGIDISTLLKAYQAYAGSQGAGGATAAGE